MKCRILMGKDECGCSATQPMENTTDTRPAIVLVAFGTSMPRARRVFEYIDRKARERFSGYDISWAFTSTVIRNKLQSQGVVTYSLQEVVDRLRTEGVKMVVFQSLHVAPGQEFKAIGNVDTSGMTIAVGDALLASGRDIEAVINAVEKDIIPGAANVLVAHGNDKYPEFNKQLIRFTEQIEKRFPDTWVCSVEGQPGTDSLDKARVCASSSGRGNFIPLMVVAGDHIMNDVMGDENDSWRQVVAAENTSCAEPLGYNNAVLDIYFRHLETALATLA